MGVANLGRQGVVAGRLPGDCSRQGGRCSEESIWILEPSTGGSSVPLSLVWGEDVIRGVTPHPGN